MLQRTSCVDNIRIKQVTFASTLQIGDSRIINQFSRAIALQREAELFFGSEVNFSSYRAFTSPIPFEPIYEPVAIIRHNIPPLIKVGNIDIKGVSSSSSLHIGNSGHIHSEARVKHIRQLLPYGHEQDIIELNKLR
ncbi:spore germination protein GerPE [Neobacillus dielmonensis]|uniref:spore germination protein GerPE n=1 Tax=Neobacillus dielmonensis TaxID=1347369 RepID=UPI0005A915A8|nr:spore germination protein GerPE [Neobacillus dielmonensis]